MEPDLECPICFDEYGSRGSQCEEWKAPCCGQNLCHKCSELLRRCPFCRSMFHGLPEAGPYADNDGRTHPWLRNVGWMAGAMAFSDGALLRGVFSLGSAGVRAVPGALSVAAAAVSEVSPAVVAGGAAGAVVVAG